MKNVIVTIMGLMISIPVFSQHLLVVKKNKRKVINLQQENNTSVYYSDWPDTSTNDVKAVLQQDILSLTPIEASDVDSIVAVVSAENDLKEAKAKQEQTKGFKKLKSYYSQKLLIGNNSEMGQFGMTVEGGIEAIDTYRLGFGFGLEKIGIDSLSARQVPFFLSFNRVILKVKQEHHVYGLATAGYNFVLNEDEYLGNNRLMTLGVGLCLRNMFIVEMYYKMQKAETTYQKNGRANLIGVNLGFIL